MAKQISNKRGWVSYVSILLATIALVLSILHRLGKEDEVVYVDAVKLITRYRGLEAAKKSQQVKREIWKTRLDTLETEFRLVVNDYNEKKNKMSKREILLMEEVIKSRKETYLNYQQSFQNEVKKQDDELSRQILNRVNDYLKRYGKKSKYKIILAATQLGSIAYADESLNITEEVLEGLNLEYDRLSSK